MNISRREMNDNALVYDHIQLTTPDQLREIIPAETKESGNGALCYGAPAHTRTHSTASADALAASGPALSSGTRSQRRSASASTTLQRQIVNF